MNTLFKYRETVCSNKEKQFVFIKGNTLFAIGKRSFISRAYKEKALQINDSQSLIEYSKRDLNPHSRNGQRILSPSCLPFHHSSILKREKRAENETRTRDPNLGKVMLYQLSYFRKYLLFVKEMRLELTRHNCHHPLKVARLPIPPFLQKRKPRV